MYNHVTPDDVADIVRDHLEMGRPVRRLMERTKERAQASSDPREQSDIAEENGDT